MKIVFYTHPNFLNHQSMPRFASMLINGMKERGHEVVFWSPQAFFFKEKLPASIKKWLSYIDQYIVFPLIVKRRLKACPPETLFVFTDQALGPWVSQVAQRPHAIHCHDFLALRSALNEIPENRTQWTGKLYQKYIQRGFSKGKYFISVSHNTKDDLHRLIIGEQPKISEVVYNGLNQKFIVASSTVARKDVAAFSGINVDNGFVLHVGGNLWYKNRVGVIQIYDAWRKNSALKIPLLMVGETPDSILTEVYKKSPFSEDIYFLSKITDGQVRTLYSAASVLLFPSIAEGFGWPIAEAMASGCPVITTNEAPMTEVAGNAAYLIRKRNNGIEDINWPEECAAVLNTLLSLPDEKRTALIESGLVNIQRFATDKTLDSIESIYKKILAQNSI